MKVSGTGAGTTIAEFYDERRALNVQFGQRPEKRPRKNAGPR